MRKLFVLIAPPASGKTTFIEEHGLEPYTITADKMRQHVSPNVEKYNFDESEEGAIESLIDYGNEGFTWKVIYEILERRMAFGQTVVMDATHLFKGAFKGYHDLAKKYQYEVIGVDLTPQISDDKELVDLLVERDSKREKKIGKRSVFEKYVSRYHDFVESQGAANTGNLKMISRSDFEIMLTSPSKTDMSQFKRIKIIGDTHGNIDNLLHVFDDHKNGDAYVFVGDLLDRGTKNVETFKFIQSLKGKNLFFLRGNHELQIQRNLLSETGKRFGKFGQTTLDELYHAAITKEDMFGYLDRLQKDDRLVFDFAGKTYIVSHTGIMPNRFSNQNALTTETELMMGLEGTRENPYQIDVDRLYAEFDNSGVINVHGHRNEFEKPVNNGDKSYNLTGYNEFRYLVLDQDGKIEVHQEDYIDVPTPEQVQKEQIENMRADSDNVKKRQAVFNSNVESYNFAKEVFFDRSGKSWTPTTLQARGYFVYNDHVIGRGFKKFFSVGETPQSKIENMTFPVNVYEKWNGYLGIAFVDPDSGEVVVVTKSGNLNEMEETLPNGEVVKTNTMKIFENTPNHDKFIEFLKANQDKSMLFEMITPLDQHIVDYGQRTEAIPIAVLNNIDGSFDRAVESGFGIEPIFIAQNRNELNTFLSEHDNDIHEGYVLRDVKDFQLKLKSRFYLKAKELRGRLDVNSRVRGKNRIDNELGYMVFEKWYYGGREWYERIQKDGVTKFSPKLALKLQDEDDKKRKINND